MTSLLVAGNSQAGALRNAINQPTPGGIAGVEVSFCFAAGGFGPNIQLIDGCPHVVPDSEKFPSQYFPDTAASRPISTYDVIVISALGYVDGGYAHLNSIVAQGCPWRYDPAETAQLVSEACWRATVRHMLAGHFGSAFARSLRAHFAGLIIVQAFPPLSELVKAHEHWRLRAVTRDPVALALALRDIQQAHLEDLCRDIGASLLSPPTEALTADGFLKERFSKPDFIHCKPEFGQLVWDQIRDQLHGRA